MLDIAMGYVSTYSKFFFLPNVVKALIEAGANVQNGKKYLYACAWFGSADVLAVLLKAGASDGPNEDCCEETALDRAARLYNENKSIQYGNCCRLLIEHALEKNPNAKIPDLIKNNEELVEYWNVCKANNADQKLTNSATPNAEIQEISYPPEVVIPRLMCVIQ